MPQQRILRTDCTEYLFTSTNFETSQHQMQEAVATSFKRGLHKFMKDKVLAMIKIGSQVNLSVVI